MIISNGHTYTFHSVHLTPGEQIGLHEQATWELSYVITGAGMRLIGDTTMPFSSGEVVLIPPGIPHCWYFNNSVTDTRGKIANITLTIHPEYLRKIADTFPPLAPSITQWNASTDAVTFDGAKAEAIIALLNDMRDQNEAEHIASILRLITLTANCHDRRIVGKRQALDKEKKRISQILIYITCNYMQDITLDDVVRHVGMNRASFCTFFKRATGQTFTHYLNQLRIEKACKLLAQPQRSIAETAYQVGFNDIPYFNRVFKRLKGVPPSRYVSSKKNAP